MEREETRENEVLNLAAGDPRVPGSQGGATVGAEQAPAEVAVISQLVWQAIHEQRRQRATISGIARDLVVDRKTVRSVLSEAAWTPYHRERSVVTVLEPFKA
jgi:hypothetical protein